MSPLLAAALLGLVVLFVFKIFKYLKWRVVMNEIGGPSIPSFWLGNFKEFKENQLNYSHEQSKTFPKVFRYWISPLFCRVVACHPETVKQVIAIERLEKAPFYALMNLWIGENGLLNCKSDTYDGVRKIFSPAFHGNILDGYFEWFVETAHTLIDKWNGKLNVSFDIIEDVALCALDNILVTSAGVRTGCQHDQLKEYIHSIEQLLQIMLRRILNPLKHNDHVFLRTQDGRDFLHHNGVTTRLMEKFIADRKKELAASGGVLKGGKKIDLIDVLLTAVDENGKPGFSEKELVQHLDGFIFAGHDTSATAMSMFLYAMAKYPHLQENCYQEIVNVVKGKNPTIEEIRSLDVLSRTLKESMRIYSTVPATSRIAKEDLILDGKRIPKGTVIVADLRAVQLNPHVWEDPLRFDPDRHLSPRDPFASLPFSAGQRNCVGQQYALLEIRTTLCMLLREFQFVLEGGAPEANFVNSILIKSTTGLHVKILKRA